MHRYLRMINQIDPTCKAKKKAKERAEGLLKRSNENRFKLHHLLNVLFIYIDWALRKAIFLICRNMRWSLQLI